MLPIVPVTSSPPSLPVRKHLLGSHSPAQKLFAGARRRFPEAPGEAVFLCNHCFQTGQDGWWGEARHREMVFQVPKWSRTCDTGAWQLRAGRWGGRPALVPGPRPRWCQSQAEAPGTQSLTEGGVGPLTTGFLPALWAAMGASAHPTSFS